MAWDLSCADWQTRLREGRPPIADLPLFDADADRAARIFNMLRLPDVPGTPMLADAAGPWFRDGVVRPAFGSFDAARQERFIREIFVLVGKKNSKTTYCAGLSLVWLLLNERPRARGLMAAPTQDITDVAFSQAAGMIRLDKGLMNRLRIQDHIKTITNYSTGASLEILTFDPSVLTGQIPTFALIDEIHEIAKSSKAANALGQIRGGMEPVPEALLIEITTQSDSPPKGIFKSELAKARAVRDGRNKVTRMLPVLYEFPEKIAGDRAQWSNIQNWPMVVPNAGRSIQISRLHESYLTAVETGQEELIRWASQHLNIEIGVGLKTDHWPGARHWEQCAGAPITLEELIERSDVVAYGIDGGGLDDLLSGGALGREKDTGRWLVWVHAWMHENVLELRKQEAPTFRDLEAAGDLTIVSKMSEAFEQLVKVVVTIRDSGKLAKVGADPYGVKIILDMLARESITQDAGLVVGISQGFRLQGTIKALEDRLSDEDVEHGAQPLMSYAVGNAKVETKGNAILITKQASGIGKIDPLMALLDAVAVLLDAPEASASVYSEERGLLIFG